MMNIKQQVSEFYNQVGWQQTDEGCYQNARYEDLRPVSREYIHRCHLRILRHIAPHGRFLLDAGSGPVQYPEYLEYTRHYQRRVCADISILALQEARKRLGNHGLYVAADIANLPFKPDSFEAVVSLHTIHHLPKGEHAHAYQELYRVLAPGSSAAVVNGWDRPLLSVLLDLPVRFVQMLLNWKNRQPGGNDLTEKAVRQVKSSSDLSRPQGTYIGKNSPRWLKQEVGSRMPLEIWVWRSVEVRFLRTMIHAPLGGRYFLRFLYWLEERFPHWFGEHGQYPLIVLHKP